MFRPSSEQYYFVVEPITLSIINPATKKSVDNANSSFKIKITKGFQQCDELKKPLEGKSANGKLNFEKCQLTFYLPSYNPDRNI